MADDPADGDTPSPPAPAAGPQLAVPNEKHRGLLRMIVEEGGFAFVSSVELAAAGDLQGAEAAREMAWEQLHSGPWHEVVPVWRDAYGMACLHVATIHAGTGELREALRALDLGLVMGGPLLRSDLDACVKKIVARIESEGAGSGSGDDSADYGLESSKSTNFLELKSQGTAKHGDYAEFSPSKASNPSRGNLTRRQTLLQGELVDASIEGEHLWSKGEFCFKYLPSRSLAYKVVERRPSPPLETFVRDYFLRSCPVIISGYIDHWPARIKWKDIEYLKRTAGDRTVPVEVGKNYLALDWKQELVTFSQFLERIKSNDNPAILTYLAQHPLFDQIEELRNDIMIPDYCCAGGGELQSLNAWFGPIGTVTPLHHDPHHNIFAQVIGKKYIRLYPPSASHDLYPHSESMLSNSSQVDLDNFDAKEFPRAADLDFMDCILEEGELLYIPPKWWHYVRSLSTSFSVSFWWKAAELSI